LDFVIVCSAERARKDFEVKECAIGVERRAAAFQAVLEFKVLSRGIAFKQWRIRSSAT